MKNNFGWDFVELYGFPVQLRRWIIEETFLSKPKP